MNGPEQMGRLAPHLVSVRLRCGRHVTLNTNVMMCLTSASHTSQGGKRWQGKLAPESSSFESMSVLLLMPTTAESTLRSTVYATVAHFRVWHPAVTP